MPTRTSGMPMPTVTIRPHFFRQIAAMRIVRRGRVDLDADNPVMPGIEREFRLQPINERRSVLVEERNESDRAFLLVPLRKSERPRPIVLASERLVSPFRGLNHLVVKRREIVLHPSQRRL